MQDNYIIDRSIAISNTDVPTRAGQRVNSRDELSKVPTPFVGMIIYIKNEDSFVYVQSLKSKKVGNIEILNAIIDQVSDFSSGGGEGTVNLKWNIV